MIRAFVLWLFAATGISGFVALAFGGSAFWQVGGAAFLGCVFIGLLILLADWAADR